MSIIKDIISGKLSIIHLYKLYTYYVFLLGRDRNRKFFREVLSASKENKEKVIALYKFAKRYSKIKILAEHDVYMNVVDEVKKLMRK
jgi:hypothetical protein